MKSLFFLWATLISCFACSSNRQSLNVIVTNPLAVARANEMIEVSASDVFSKLKLADTAQIIVLDEKGEQIPYQIT